ncbi:MAG: MCE family protein [Patulibacter sp.]|nr:MCE family protein [Patulibacter sp.]
MTSGWRGHLKEVAALISLIVVGLAVGGYIFANQNVTAPSWMPVLGKTFFDMEARFTSASGVMPGQGQTVTISGINVGKVTGVRLDRGQAVVGFRLEEKYRDVYPDATVLLRPKTPLKDMTVELNPGTKAAGDPLPEGAVLDVSATQPDVNFDEFLATIDTETQAALQMLLGDAAQALGKDGGKALARAFRRFEPLSRNGKTASELLIDREKKIKRLVTNIGRITEELGGENAQLTEFVESSTAALGRFAAQNDNVAETIALLPDTLDSTNEALAKAGDLSVTLDEGLTALEPATSNLASSLEAVEPFSKKTTPVLRDQIRPFARDAQPTVRKLVPVSQKTAEAIPDLRRFTDVLNSFFNLMAYDPPGDGPNGQSYLFYLPWAGHNTNSAFSSQDGVSPLPRSMVSLECGALELLQDVLPRRNPYVDTISQLLNLPSFRDPAGCKGSQVTK